jgi:HEAT repeat protein
MFPRAWLLVAAVLASWLAHPAPVRAQLTSEEQRTFMQLLQEKDGPAAFDKRLRLIGDALERWGDLKRMPTTSSQASLKAARIPVSDALAFLDKFLGHKAETTKRAALRMVGDYGPEATPAIPRLQQLMDDPHRGVREDAMLTLAKIEPGNRGVAAAIVARLGAKSADDSEKRSAMKALILMAPAVDKAAVPDLSRFREHKWTEMCMYAHEAVGKIVDLPRPTLQQLRDLEAIDWRNPPDQGYAVFAAIKDAGPAAEFAVPLLVELLITNPPTYIQCAVFDSLAKVKTGNPRIISLLLTRLTADDLVLRERARQALTLVELKEPKSVREMAKGLRFAEPNVRLEATVKLRVAADLGKITPAGLSEIAPALIETLKEVNDNVPIGLLENYLMLLRHLGKSGAPAAEAMLRLYTSATYFQKVPAKEAAHRRAKQLAVLANIGVPKEGRPLVLEVLKKGPSPAGDDGYAYAAAARAVGTFGPEARQAVPWLLPALKADGKEPVFYFIDWSGKGGGFPPTSARLEAIRTLGTIGPDAKEALPALKEIAARKAGPPGTLDAIIPQEARRAVAAIQDETGK